MEGTIQLLEVLFIITLMYVVENLLAVLRLTVVS